MTTKFGIGIVFRKAQVPAKFHCPTSTVTLFSEYGEGRIRSSPVTERQKRPANSGGSIVYNYPCYVRRRGWMPRGLLFVLVLTNANNRLQLIHISSDTGSKVLNELLCTCSSDT